VKLSFSRRKAPVKTKSPIADAGYPKNGRNE
jgi:hypothetical protein